MPIRHRIAKLIFKCLWLIINHHNMKLYHELDEKRYLAGSSLLNSKRKHEWTLFCSFWSKCLCLPALQNGYISVAQPWCGSGLLPGPRASNPAQTFAVKAEWNELAKLKPLRMAAGASCCFPNGCSFLATCQFAAPHFACNLYCLLPIRRNIFGAWITAL